MEHNEFLDNYRTRKAEVNSMFDEVSNTKAQVNMLVSMYFSELNDSVNTYLKAVNKFNEYLKNQTVTDTNNWSEEELNNLKVAREELNDIFINLLKSILDQICRGWFG